MPAGGAATSVQENVLNEHAHALEARAAGVILGTDVRDATLDFRNVHI